MDKDLPLSVLGASWQPPPPPTTQQTWPPAFKARPPQQGGPVSGVKRAKKAVQIHGRTPEDFAGAAAATAGDTAAEHAKGDGKSSEEVAAAACPHFTDTQNVTLVSAEGFEETKAAIRASQAWKDPQELFLEQKAQETMLNDPDAGLGSKEERKKAIKATQASQALPLSTKLYAEEEAEPQQSLPEAKKGEADYEEVPSDSEEEEKATITAVMKTTKIRMRMVPRAAPIPISSREELDELHTCEQYFENIGKAPWEAQKLRNKEMRGQILPLLQTRMKRAVADLQLGQFNEEAAEEPEMRTEAPAAAAHPEVRDEGPRYKMTICRHWQRGFCKKGDTCTFAHGEEERRAPTICKHWKTGSCKKGDKCAFTHSEVLTESPAKKARTKPPASERPPEQDGFNSQGLQIRAGKAECQWYRRTGICFIGQCTFSHLELTPEQDPNISSLICLLRALECAKKLADKERVRDRDAAPSSQTAASSSNSDEQSALLPAANGSLVGLTEGRGEGHC